jgi:uncharacterized integral membrane protein
VSWTWVSLVVGLVLGIALVDFLVQNSHSARIEFFSASGRVPLSVALLAAALAGAAVVLVVGIARMVQLRRGLGPGRRSDASSEGSAGGSETTSNGQTASSSRDPAAAGTGS